MPRCKITACPVAKDGKCLEGRGLTCPNLIPDDEADITEAPTSEDPDLEDDAPVFESLPRAEPLDLSEARYYSQRGRAVVIVLAGMRECGKTSLLARIHQLFLSGPISGFDFAGSRSLPRFEELNWLATIESGASQPRMTRSSTQFDNSFLHVTVRPTNGGMPVDLLLNDISGETLGKAAVSQTACDDLSFLPRADHLVVLVDAAALATASLRFDHIARVMDFLQRTVQGGHCGQHTMLHIVLAKLDMLGGKTEVADDLENQIKAAYEGKFGVIEFCRIAARPMDGSLPTNELIGQLFSLWIQQTLRYEFESPASLSRKELPRDFCRFGI